MKTIKEIRDEQNNNESVIKKGVYVNSDGSYTWMTYTKSGTCKKLETAMKKAGIK